MGLADGMPALLWDSNPASQAELPGSELWVLAGNTVQGGGLGWGMGPLKLGFAVERLSPVREMIPGDKSDNWRTGLNLSLRITPKFLVGFLWNRTWGNALLDGRNPLALGVAVRPWRWLGVGLAAYNLSRERFWSQTRIHFGVGVAVRPGIDWLTVEGTARFDETAGYLDPGLNLQVEIVPGIRLGASSRMRKVDGQWEFSAGGLLTVSAGPTDVLAGMEMGPDSKAIYMGAARLRTLPEESVIRARHYTVWMPLAGAAENRRYPLFGTPRRAFLDERKRLEELAADGDVDTVVLEIRPIQAGWAQTQELASSIAQMRKHGKKVIAYLVTGGNREYYLASQADEIYMTPGGPLFLIGIHSKLTFYKDLLDFLGVKGEFVRVGKYKSMPEGFMRNEPTPEYEEAHNAMLDDYYGQLVSGIAQGRKVQPETVKGWIDAGPYTPNKAKAAGLLDGVLTAQEFRKMLAKKGVDPRRTARTYPYRKVREEKWVESPLLGVLVINGMIADGSSFTVPLVGTKVVGADTVIEAIDRLKNDSSIRGVLLRIDSPGGSSLGSELINRALDELAAKKPLVVSMGNMAASGGYYVAVEGRRIFASPGTATGSIGIYAARVSLEGLYDKLKLHRFHFKRGENADIMDMDGTLTPERKALVMERLQEFYDLFLKRVDEGRALSLAEVAAVAQGRVWSGQRALKKGLVDERGGVWEAYQFLRREAGIAPFEKVNLVYYPRSGFGARLQMALTGTGAGEPTLLDGEWMARLRAFAQEFVWALDPWLVDFSVL